MDLEERGGVVCASVLGRGGMEDRMEMFSLGSSVAMQENKGLDIAFIDLRDTHASFNLDKKP